METENLIRAQKAMAWERAKGELRSMVIADGHIRPYQQTSERLKEHEKRWLAIDKRIEEFIADFENDGLHE